MHSHWYMNDYNSSLFFIITIITIVRIDNDEFEGNMP